MRGSGRRRKHDAAEDVGVQLVLSFGLLESLLPIGGSELEQAIGGRGAEQAEQVPEIAVGLDAVQACTGEQGNEHGVDDGAVGAADKEPVSTSEDLPAQVQFADVVVYGEAAVVEEATQRDSLIGGVAEASLNGRLVEHAGQLGVAPLEELVDDRSALVAPHGLLFFSGRVRDGPLDSKQRSDVRKCHPGSVGI